MEEQSWTEYIQETIDFKHTVEHFEYIAVEANEEDPDK